MNRILEEIKSYVIIALGMLMYAFSATAFQIPNKIVGGGATGVGTVIYYLTDGLIPVGVSYFLINVVLISIALKVLGPKFGIKSIFAICVGSFLLGILQPLFPESLVTDRFMCAVISGILTGAGIALALAQGGSTGGTDIVAMLVTK